jgi:hypothetical protein
VSEALEHGPASPDASASGEVCFHSMICRGFEARGRPLERLTFYPRVPVPHSAPRGVGNHKGFAEAQFAIGVIARGCKTRKILALRVPLGRQVEGALRNRWQAKPPR